MDPSLVIVSVIGVACLAAVIVISTAFGRGRSTGAAPNLHPDAKKPAGPVELAPPSPIAVAPVPSSDPSSASSTTAWSDSARAVKRADESVHVSVSAGDAEFEPARVEDGALRARFSVKAHDIELKGTLQVEIVGGDASVLKQRVIRYRPLLLAILERALRSGPRVRSLPAVVSRVKPIGGSSDVVGLEGEDGFLAAFAGSTLVVCAARHDKVSLLAWTELDGTPKSLFDVGERRALTMSPSPDGARVAMVLGAARKPGGGVDPYAQLVVIDAVSGASRVLLEAGATFRFHVSPQIAWSTGADRLAIEGITPQGRSVKILDPATGAAVGETGPALGATLIGWERDDRDAVILEIDGGWNRWRPGGTPERIHLPFMMSPDTRYMLVVRELPADEGGERVPDLDVVRRDQGAWTPMESEEPDELARDMLLKDVLEHRVRWIGEHGAVMPAPEPMVLDLSSLASRYLVPPMPGVTFVCSSPSGKVVVRDANGHLLWGTAAAWT